LAKTFAEALKGLARVLGGGEMRDAILILALGLFVASPGGAATSEEKCEISKNKTVGAYAACRHKAEAKAIQKGGVPDYSKCDAKFLVGWSKADAKAAKKGTVCVDGLEGMVVQGVVADHTDAIAAALAGGGMISECGNGVADGTEQCDGADLGGATCGDLVPMIAPVTGTLACDAQCRFDLGGCALLDPACYQPSLELTESDRHTSFNDGLQGLNFCDEDTGPPIQSPDWQGAGWYRFSGSAGTAMPESPTVPYDCGTSASGWLNASHPAVSDGVVSLQVCFSWGSDDCNWSTMVDVVNCEDFYLYQLPLPPTSCLRYCGE
jgi:hypothetical protein